MVVYMASHSTLSDEFGDVFRRLDEDGDGKISEFELQQIMRTVGEELSLEDAEVVIQSCDADGDGRLNLEEFAELVNGDAEEKDEDEDALLREAFEMYAVQGRGCITPKSLKRMLSKLGASKEMEECSAMIRRFDLNGDGVLSFEEFRVMMH